MGVDLDGTLAYYDGWVGPTHIGAPIPDMVERVKAWRKEGREVRIFTARVAEDNPGAGPNPEVVASIEAWCEEVFGEVLPVTNVKDYGMVELWDDRAITVEQNTGRMLAPQQPRFTP